MEQFSFAAARPLVEQVWGVAKNVGAKSFKFEPGYEVQDDHLALIKAGIPTIDIIDFDYPHWHKLTDTPDKISGADGRGEQGHHDVAAENQVVASGQWSVARKAGHG